MSVKTSYSQNSTYIQCPKHWYIAYKEGYEAISEGASTYFGSAIDSAVSDMLEGKSTWLDTFYDKWKKSYNYGKATVIFDNPNINYSYKDFDQDLLTSSHLNDLVKWANQLGFNVRDATEAVQLYKNIASKKKNPFKKPSKLEMQYFNRASWLGLKAKGEILLEAFHKQFYPKIKKVLATQIRAQIQDPNTGDIISGVIDMVLEIEGHNKPIIFDLKTASQPYKQEEIDLTQQLTLYSAMKSQEFNTDLVGYIVLSKNIQKDSISTCKKCGNIKNSSHRTCNAILSDDSRCGGEWDEKIVPKPEIQVMIEQKTLDQINNLLIDYGNIIYAMKNEVVYKNTDKCNNWYGSRCPFYGICHKNDYSEVRKKK